MKTSRTWIVLLVAFGMSSGAGALEIDGTSSGGTTWSPGETVFAGAGSLALTQRFGQDALLALRGSLSYDSSGALAYGVDRAEYDQTLAVGDSSIVSFRAGRGAVSDTTGLVAPLAADGFAVSYRAPGFGVDLSARTFALLSPERALLLTATDLFEASAEETLFGPARVLGSLALVFPERLGRTNLAVEYLTQFDGRAVANPAIGEDTLRADYLSAVFSAPVTNSLFATASLTGSRAVYEVVGSGSISTYSWLVRAEARGYLRSPNAPTGTLRVLYASGRDQPALLPDPTTSEGSGFVPGPFAVPWTLAPVPLANVIAVAAEATALPFGASGLWWLDDTVLRASVTALAKPAPGAFGVGGLNDQAATGIYGYEMEITAVVEPFRDLDFRVEGAIFLPDRSAIRVLQTRVERTWRIGIATSLAW